MLGLLLGLLLVVALGVIHHYGLMVIKAGRPGTGRFPAAAIIITFAGLVILHTGEILAIAALYGVLIDWGELGSLGSEHPVSWTDLVYFSGINFTTLGLAEIQAEGALRLVSMMQSLAGFMLLTWSATFLYTICEKSWND